MNGSEVAVKFDNEMDENVVNEKVKKVKDLTNQLQHQNVLKFFDIKGEKQLIIVMEKADTDRTQTGHRLMGCHQSEGLMSLSMVSSITSDVLI